MSDLLLKNCRVVTENADYTADIEVKKGVIKGIREKGQGEAAGRVIDCSNLVVIPGCIDSHVHFNEPGYTYREGFVTGSRAAAAGGITMVADMPIANKPQVTGAEALAVKREAVRGKSVVDYSLWGGLTADNLDKLAGLKESGVPGVKGFTVDQLADFKWLNNGVLYEAFKKCAELDLMVILHCENNEMVNYRLQQIDRQGKDQAGQIRDFLRVFAEETELVAVDNVIELAAAAGARVHILHASLPETVNKVARAKEQGLRITVETCPHYLVLNSEDLFSKGALAKCTPPVRSREKVEGLWACLLDGKVDIVSSDHSPSTVEEKEMAADFWEAWGGIQGVQYLLQLMLSEGVNKRQMPLQQLAALLSANPARLLGEYPRKGCIQVGSEATFTVLDMNKQWQIEKDDIQFKNKHTPYLGMQGRGRAVYTILRGRVLPDKVNTGQYITG